MIIRILAGAVLLLLAVIGWQRGSVISARSEADRAGTELAAAQHALGQAHEIINTERAGARTMSQIGAAHEEDRAAATAVPAAVAAGVRDGSLQLRDDLATCSTARLSAAVAGAIERDAHAQLRAEVAGALVQIGRDADDHVRACQAVVGADRAGTDP